MDKEIKHFNQKDEELRWDLVLAINRVVLVIRHLVSSSVLDHAVQRKRGVYYFYLSDFVPEIQGSQVHYDSENEIVQENY